MGQLVARFRQWCKKLKTPEKFKNGELSKLVEMDQDDASTSERMGKDEDEVNEEGADLKPVTVDEKEEKEMKEKNEEKKEMKEEEEDDEENDEREEIQEDSEVAKKLEDVEILIKSQEKLIDQHKVRIEGLEHSMETVSQKMKEQNDEELKAAENREKTQEEKTNNQRELLQEHSRILEQHEQKLESQSGEIETLRQMLEDKQAVTHHPQGAEGKHRSPTQKYEQLEKEVKLQLEQQQRLLDNLFAGFIVAFIIVVVICMLPRSEFSLSKQSFLDTFWAALRGLGLSSK